MFTKLRGVLPFAWARVAPAEEAYDFSNSTGWDASSAPAKRRFNWKKFILISAFTALGVALLVAEMRTSWIQAKVITGILHGAGYKVEKGEGGQVFHTANGPYDERLGYTKLNDRISRLKRLGYEVEGQARWSPRLNTIANYGMFPIYREKAQAGLHVLDRNGKPLHATMYPEHTYHEFASIPPVVVRTALYIENREILDGWAQQRNPAIEWDRLAKAVLDYGVKQVNRNHSISGGSTLATQLEKVRHSPGGRTAAALDKARQITSASLRAYMEGPYTLESRRRIVRDYINSIPLAATAASGEVIGLADGLKFWYGSDPDEVSRLLNIDEKVVLSLEDERRRATYYRQVLSLLLALNRPTFFLRNNPKALEERTDAYLRVLAADGFISARLRDGALYAKTQLKPAAEYPERPINIERKNTDAVRYSLLNLLGVSSLYELDRLDLTVETTLHGPASSFAAQTMEHLNDPAYLSAAGLVGERMLSAGQGQPVVYTLTMFERGNGVNRLVLQLDNANQALNLNEGSKLELGSTAKLRTIATYLEIVSSLHEQLVQGKDRDKLPMDDPDKLTKWAAEYLQDGGDQSLAAMLDAAMNRKYSASPGEAFYTGGGLHSFANFDSKDNGSILTVREGFRRSVNLVFIRLMRDIVDYYLRRTPGYSRGLFTDEDHPMRERYLARFADREATQFMRGFYDRYSELTPDEALETLFSQRDLNATRFSVLYRSVRPNATFGEFQLAMLGYVTEAVKEKRVQELYDMYAPGKMDWNDRGYVAGIHPLELWLVHYLSTNPGASWELIRDSSKNVRQEVYRWLFKSRSKIGKDLRIRSVLEADAFVLVHQSWKRQGFPFQRLVPSLATSIGSSGDTPAALADLAGVILNGGTRLPNTRVERLRFAEGTPFETRLVRKADQPVRVFTPEVAARLHQEMLGVVEFGTARRAFRSVVDLKGVQLAVAGKTGTGDNRVKTLFTVGKARNRTATFVFTVGDRYFGTIVAYVPGEEAGSYKFSSALPVQLFKLLVPGVVKVLAGGPAPAPIVVPPPRPPAPKLEEPVEHPTIAGLKPDPRTENPEAPSALPSPTQPTPSPVGKSQ